MKTYYDLLCILNEQCDSEQQRKDALCDGEFLSRFDVTQEQIEDLFNRFGDL